MIALEDLEIVLEYLEEKRFSVAEVYLRNMIKAERESEYDVGCQNLASELLERGE